MFKLEYKIARNRQTFNPKLLEIEKQEAIEVHGYSWQTIEIVRNNKNYATNKII